MSTREDWSNPDMFKNPAIRRQIAAATSDDREVRQAEPPAQPAKKPSGAQQRTRRRLEQELQIAIFDWADLAIFPDYVSERARWLLPPTKIGEFLHHTPNGGARSKAEGGIFKAMGVRPGYPDISFDLALANIEDPQALRFYPGFRCELKVGDGKMTPSQILKAEQLQRAGYIFAEARSLDEFQAALYQYLNLGQVIHRSLWDERQTLG